MLPDDWPYGYGKRRGSRRGPRSRPRPLDTGLVPSAATSAAPPVAGPAGAPASAAPLSAPTSSAGPPPPSAPPTLTSAVSSATSSVPASPALLTASLPPPPSGALPFASPGLSGAFARLASVASPASSALPAASLPASVFPVDSPPSCALPSASSASSGASARSASAASPATSALSTPSSLASPPLSRAVPAPAPSHPPRRRLCLPSALHPLLWADRKAVLGLGVLLLLAVAYAIQHFWLGRPQPVAVPTATAKAAPSATAAAGDTEGPAQPVAPGGESADTGAGPEPSGSAQLPLVIDVAGRVVHPGVLSLPAGSRVADALRAAGGAQPGVETDGLNLARVLVDGEQVLVGSPAPAAGNAVEPAAPKAPVSINRATQEQLDALPGIGPALARRILDFRTQHGPFRSLEQLRQISGIGGRKFAELRPLLVL